MALGQHPLDPVGCGSHIERSPLLPCDAASLEAYVRDGSDGEAGAAQGVEPTAQPRLDRMEEQLLQVLLDLRLEAMKRREVEDKHVLEVADAHGEEPGE